MVQVFLKSVVSINLFCVNVFGYYLLDSQRPAFVPLWTTHFMYIFLCFFVCYVVFAHEFVYLCEGVFVNMCVCV